MFERRSYFKIYGGKVLKGEIEISGAKNSILPLLFASLLCEGNHEFENVPGLKDVSLALNILSSLGLSYKKEDSHLLIKNFNLESIAPCPISAKSFRASILCLAPLLVRLGRVRIPLPGGCEIGLRPIDLHLKALRKMGANLFLKNDEIHGEIPKGGLKASEIKLDFPSVGATENVIMACILTKGTSVIKNIACEPEIDDLIKFLRSLGAKIKKKALREVEIIGVSSLKPSFKPYTVIPDRIEAGTLLLAGACTKGEVKVKKCCPWHLSALLQMLKASGFCLESQANEISLKKGSNNKAMYIKTGVYPYFPTDLQSQFMALMTQLKGVSFLEETVFEKRFRYIEQLNLLNANIHVRSGTKAFVKGPVLLSGHQLEAKDLRAGAGLVLASLAAQGESRVYGLQHIERGYEKLFLKLQTLGADIQFLKEE